MKTYIVEVSRGERYWVVDVPELGYATQARHLRELEEMTRDLIAGVTGVPEDSFELATQIKMPDPVAEHLSRAEKLREEARDAQAQAAEEVRLAARQLRNDGLPLRDIGVLLHVSHQRAGQLIAS